jgi:hypothetical protein
MAKHLRKALKNRDRRRTDMALTHSSMGKRGKSVNPQTAYTMPGSMKWK